MVFLAEYGLFLAKSLTLVFLLLFAVSAIVNLTRNSPRGDGLEVRPLNQHYDDLEATLRGATMSWRELRKHRRRLRKEQRARSKERNWVFVLRFQGDLRAGEVDNLREEISAILTTARPGQDQVVLCLESGGGFIHAYGLAAAQLLRLRDAGLEITVVVDRIAASGGYLMAAVAHRIIAAPLAILGSIGVVAQIPNVHRLLKRHDVDVEVLTAGQYKRTLTVFGENTPERRTKFQQDLDEAHGLFKSHLQRFRPQLDLETVATGEHWYGEQALERQLIDALGTSDDLLLQLSREHSLYTVHYRQRQPLTQRLGLAFGQSIERILHPLVQRWHR